MRVKKQQLEPHMEQLMFKIKKGVCQGCTLSPCLFNSYAEHIIRNAGLAELQVESRLLREIPTTSGMQMIPL